MVHGNNSSGLVNSTDYRHTPTHRCTIVYLAQLEHLLFVKISGYNNKQFRRCLPTLVRTLAFPMMTTPYFALVRATFRRRASFRNPIPWCSLALTHERMMKSFSRPWNASTLATSISCNRDHMTSHMINSHIYIEIRIKNSNNGFFRPVLQRTCTLISDHVTVTWPITYVHTFSDHVTVTWPVTYVHTFSDHVTVTWPLTYHIQSLRHGSVELHVLDDVCPLTLVGGDDSHLVRFDSTLHQSCHHLLNIHRLTPAISVKIRAKRSVY